MKFYPEIDNFPIEIDSGGVETNLEKAIVEYDIPYADGAVCDDLGVKARRFKFKTVWKKENYEYYEEFLEHAAKRGVNHFVHPELGLIVGRMKNLVTTHDERIRYADIEIEFVEDKGAEASPTFAPSLVPALEECFENICEALTESTAAQLEAEGYNTKLEWKNGLSNVLDFVRKVSAATARITAAIQNGLNILEDSIKTVTSAINSVASLVNFVATLPGAIISTITRAVDNIKNSFKSILNAPALFISSFKNALNGLKESFGWGSNKTAVIGASLCAIAIGEMLVKDEELKSVVRADEDGTAPNALGGIPPRETPHTLTANELTETLVSITDFINEGIEAARADGCPKAAAELQKTLRLLQDHIINVSLSADRMITVEIETPMPLFAVLLRHGIPIGYAERIAALNDFKNPNFVSGEVRLYARRN